MRKTFIALIAILLVSTTALKAQDIGQIISGSAADANKYFKAYFEPFGKGEIINLGRGWFNTARVHKPLGFDITVNIQLALVPESKQNFVFNNSDFTTFKLPGGITSATLPTFMGNKVSQNISVSTNVAGRNVSYQFQTPAGVGDDIKKAISVSAVPLPIAQFGLGIFKNTELKLRYFPSTDVGGSKIGVFGLAVQNEFGNYLPFIKKLPFLSLSALAGYNTVTTTYDLTGKGMAGVNQRAELKVSTFTVQGIASVKLALLEAYTAVGYTSGTCDASLLGTYNVPYTDVATGFSFNNAITDPVALNYENSGISSTWGLRLNFALLKVFADYTFANYNTVGAGIAFSFR